MNSPLRQDKASSDPNTWIVDAPSYTAGSPLSGKATNALIKSKLTMRIRAAPMIVREYRPSRYRTVLSERQLNDCGVKVLSHQTEQWLVPLDADNIHEPPVSSSWHDDVSARIKELRALAVEEELAFNAKSAEDVLDFTSTVQATERPSAFLLGNGNIRLVWENEAREQIGLQFIGDGDIQYILFADRGGRLAQALGSDRRDAVLRIVTATGLRHLFTP